MSYGKRFQSIAPLAEKDLLPNWIGKMCIFSAPGAAISSILILYKQTVHSLGVSVQVAMDHGQSKLPTPLSQMLSTAGISSSPHCIGVLYDFDRLCIYAVKNNYWYQMYINDLPVWGIVGDVEEVDGGQQQYYVWTHKKFDIGYNGDQIVDINLTSDGKVLLEPDMSIAFSLATLAKNIHKANYRFIYIAE